MDAILQCNSCRHGVSLHSGSGCTHASCYCGHTKESSLDVQIKLEIQEYQAQYQATESKEDFRRDPNVKLPTYSGFVHDGGCLADENPTTGVHATAG